MNKSLSKNFQEIFESIKNDVTKTQFEIMKLEAIKVQSKRIFVFDVTQKDWKLENIEFTNERNIKKINNYIRLTNLIPRMRGFITLNNCIPYLKNPKIAKIFREIGLADELRSGVRNITNYSKVYSGDEPIFEDGEIFKAKVPHFLKKHFKSELKSGLIV